MKFWRCNGASASAEALVHEPAIGQTRKAVVVGEEPDLLLGSPAIADVQHRPLDPSSIGVGHAPRAHMDDALAGPRRDAQVELDRRSVPEAFRQAVFELVAIGAHEAVQEVGDSPAS